MAFFRVSIGGGGGSGSDIYLGQAPDATWASNGSNLNNNVVATVAVTQKPRFVMVIMLSSNAKEGLIGLYDVKNDKAYRFGYWSSAKQDSIWTNYSSYITSVTDTTVTVKQVYSNASVRTWVNCYYDNGGSSGGGIIDYNFVKNMVDNHTHTYEWDGSDVADVNDGGMYIDYSNKVVYAYADFTLKKNITVSTQTIILKIQNVTGLLPYDASNNTMLKLPVLVSTTATNNPVYVMFKNGSNTCLGSTTNVVNGTRSVVWGVWSLRSL